MTNRLESSQGDGGNSSITASTQPPRTNRNLHHLRGNDKVYKSGYLFLSSKGIGWTSWKKRWFRLTRTSLVFFRSEPNDPENTITLGGIDLNSSGSVVVKEDKKLLTVLFPDGRDVRSEGRGFTLKAETLEDLYDWKTALEEALSSAPSAALVGQNAIFRNNQGNVVDGSPEQGKDRQPAKSFVTGQPILLALEDINGNPTFLEKALRFIEERGVKVEGILRQAADVDDVEHRIHEYEKGESELSPLEDPHVIADCVKYVLRELPSSPVPASACNALIAACRTERSKRLTEMRKAICDSFPEPNRRLLQRILMMMQAVASNKAENRMSISAVAACMAPLLLRPLMAGDCQIEHNFDMGADGSVQLLQAAAAANHAQAIVITLLEEYDNLFGERPASGGMYSNSEKSGTESEELTEDGDEYDDEDYYTSENSDDNIECASNESAVSTEFSRNKEHGKLQGSTCSDSVVIPQAESPPFSPFIGELEQDNMKTNENLPRQSNDVSTREANKLGDELFAEHAETSISNKSLDVLNGTVSTIRQGTVWGRTPGKKNRSIESIDLPDVDEAQIQKLEDAKSDLQHRILEEAMENARLQESLEKRKNGLHERRMALEKDVARLQEQLEKEKDLRAVLESGLKTSRGPIPASSTISEKVRVDLNEIAQAQEDVANLTQKADDLGMQLSQQREQNSRFQQNTCNQQPTSPRSRGKYKDKFRNAETGITPIIHERVGRSKYDVYSEKTNNDKVRKQEPSHLTNENSTQSFHMDPVPNQRSGGSFISVSSSEQSSGKHVSSSRRSGARSEVANSTASALSRLSNRLNFLKERRTQMTNDMQQNIDKGESSSDSSCQAAAAAQNSEKGKRPETRTQNANEQQNIDKSQSSGSGQNTEKGKKQEARLPGGGGIYMDNNNNTSQISRGQFSERKGSDSNLQTLRSSSPDNNNNQSDKGRIDNQANVDRGKSESSQLGGGGDKGKKGSR